jgi:hypothetical protein
MATRDQIESAAATPKHPVIGGKETDGHHILSGLTLTDAEQARADRLRTRAARYTVRHARTPADPDATRLLDMLGLTHDQAMPEPAAAREVA